MDENNMDAINNLINSIQEKMNNDTSNDKSESKSNADFSSVLNSLSGNSSTSNSSFDPSILLKFQKIMSRMNAENPQKNLLLSLKPFLRKSRQDKINEYMTILNVITALDSLKDKGD